MLTDEMARTGQWLFRWRSYLPLIILLLFPLALKYPYESHLLNLAWEAFCPSIAVLGLTIRIATVGFSPRGTSERGTKSMEAEILNTTGMYSITRNPLYLGNFLVFTGILLYVGSWYLVLIGVLAYWLYYERIILAEEVFLDAKYGEVFRQWAANTPVFIPRLRQWRSPSMEFSVRSIIRREYHTLFTMTVIFTGVEAARDYSILKHFELAPHWTVIFLCGLSFYIVARFFTKRTRLLNHAGR